MHSLVESHRLFPLDIHVLASFQRRTQSCDFSFFWFKQVDAEICGMIEKYKSHA